MTNVTADPPKQPKPLKKPEEQFITRVLKKALEAQGFGLISAVFGIIVLVAAASRFGLSLATLALGVIGAIILATLYFVFSRATRERKGTSVISVVFLWTITLLFLTALCLVSWSVFFNKPLPLRDALLTQLGTARNAAEVTEERTLDAIRTQPVRRSISEIIISETMTPRGIPTNSIVEFLRRERPNIGYHFIVDRDGFVYPYVDTDSAIAHTPRHNANSIAIGLEHTGGEAYSPAQLKGLEKLLQGLVDRFELSPLNVYSKEELDPRRPRDITSHMDQIRGALGEQSR